MALILSRSSSYVATPESLVVYYKYIATMPVYQKTMDAFIESVSSKWREFVSQKVELHVSPFYKYKGMLVWQPTFDFDGDLSKVDLIRFCESEIIDTYNWYVEETKDGYHLYSCASYSGLRLRDIEKLRNLFARKYKSYTSLDIRSSIRHLPIRRLALLQVPVPIRRFGIKPDDIKDELHFASVLQKFVVPTKIYEFDREIFRTLR